MKKLLLLLLIFISVRSYAQYPNGIQTLGNDSNVIAPKGGFKARVINFAFTDTAQANTQHIKEYPGAQIFTTSDNKFWLRNSTATAWIEKGSGGVGSGIDSLHVSNDSVFTCTAGSCTFKFLIDSTIIYTDYTIDTNLTQNPGFVTIGVHQPLFDSLRHWYLDTGAYVPHNYIWVTDSINRNYHLVALPTYPGYTIPSLDEVTTVGNVTLNNIDVGEVQSGSAGADGKVSIYHDTFLNEIEPLPSTHANVLRTPDTSGTIVTRVKINGTTVDPDSTGTVDLGTISTVDTTGIWVHDITFINDSLIRIWKGATSFTIRTGPGSSGGGGGVGGYNSNIGSGYRLAVPNTNNIKTLFGNGVTIDSTTNANALTFNASFAGLNDVLFTSLANNQVAQYDLASGKWKNQNTLPFSLSGLRNNDYFIYDSLNGYWKNYTANITPTWSKPGDSVVTGNVLGSTNNRSLNIITNNIRYAQFDSLGGLNIFPGATPKDAFSIYRNSSTTLRAFYIAVESLSPVIYTTNSPITFKTNYNGGSHLENFKLEVALTSATIGGSPQATITGKLNSKVPIPATAAEASYSLEVQNNSGTHRGGVGIDSLQNLVLGFNQGLKMFQDNTSAVGAVPGVGTLFRVFYPTGNIMIKNKGTYTEDTTSRLTVVSDTLMLAQGSIPAPVMDSVARKGILTALYGGSITNAGSGYTNGSFANVALTGGTGVGANATFTVAGGVVTVVNQTNQNRGRGYTVGDVLSATLAGGSGFQWTVSSLSTAPKGLQVYDSSLLKNFAFDGTRWTEMGKILSGSATLDFGSTLAGAVTDLTMTVTGAADGDVVTIGVPNGSYPATGTFNAWVSAANIITIRYANNSLTLTQDPASGTFKVKVFKD